MRMRIVWFILLLGVAGGGLLLWRMVKPAVLGGPSVVQLPPGQPPAIPAGPSPEELPIQVRTYRTSRAKFADTLPVAGTIRGQTEVPLKFELSGLVKTLPFHEGEVVGQGEEIAALEDRDVQLRVEYNRSKVAAADAQQRLAATRLQMQERLFQLGAIIKPKLEESRLEHEQAQAQLDTAGKELALAEGELAKTHLRAPMAGVLGTVEVEPGELVTPQTTIGLLADVASVWVELGVIERDIQKITLGQAATVTVDAFPGSEFQGTIEQMTPVIEGKSRTLTARVKIANETGSLLPGMFARAEISVFEKEDALMVPTTALQDLDGDGAFEAVFTVDELQIAHTTPVRLGYLTTDYAEITEGLEEEQQVVVEARGKLTDGAKILLIETEESGLQREEPKAPGLKKADEE